MAAQEQSKLLPAYLAVGEDALKRRTVLERLRKRVSQLGDLEFNHDEFDGERASGSDIAVACNTLPFASDLRLVEVAHAEKLGKQDVDVLCAYLSAPSDSTVLVLSAEKLAKNTRLYKAAASIGKASIIDCAPMKRYELVRALRSMAVGHGVTLTESAAEKLVMYVGEDTIKLDTELRKLALAHAGSGPISDGEIELLVARTNEAKPWELVDAFSARDAKTCLRLLPLLGSTSSYALIGMCTTRLRELCCAKSLDDRGEGHALAETLKVPSWRVKNHIAWSRGFTNRELQDAFTTARDCERAMKSGSDPDAAFRTWLFETICK
ncbi:MAG: DNA polymerase III subunit delta [Eggerthellaceae bacterium]|nr:DNA polymerase III subunit delta [Eggerthellaceae bacterium]